MKIHITRLATLVAVALFTISSMPMAVRAVEVNTERVSVGGTSSSPVEADATSANPSASADGRYVVFESDATNLVSDDTNGRSDIFVMDRNTHTVTRVSQGPGDEANGSSTQPSISADGRYVAFESAATNIISDDLNGESDVFLMDRDTGTVTRITEGVVDGSGGGDGPGGGFGGDSISTSALYETNGGSHDPKISADGKFVAFYSSATNLIASDTNGLADVFVAELSTNTVTRVSETGTSGSPVEASGFSFQPVISADGRYVVFESNATNLVASDTNGDFDVFIMDRDTHTVSRVSEGGTAASPVEANNTSADAAISADGRYVVFASIATNLVDNDTNGAVDVFRMDRDTHTLTRVSEGGTSSAPVETNGYAEYPSISADGRYVAYQSSADNLVDNDTNVQIDVFVTDTETHTNALVSRAGTEATPVQGDATSERPFILSDGSAVVYRSYATTLVSDDTNGRGDIYVSNNPMYVAPVSDDSDGSTDTDSDGVTKAIEAAAPNAGDANNDGTIDSEQAKVTSLVNVTTNSYSVLESATCTANDTVTSDAEPTDIDKSDSEFDYPAGLLDFSLTGCGVGATETITQYHYGVEYTNFDDLVLRKFDPTDGTYAPVDSAVFSEETIGGEAALKVVYQVTDGGPLDLDGVANGAIVDPVGVAEGASALSETGTPTYLLFSIGAALIASAAYLAYATRKKITKIAVRLK